MLILLRVRSKFCEGFFRTTDKPEAGVNQWITFGCRARDLHYGHLGALGGVSK